MKLPTDLSPDIKGILPAAYIGVDGNRYRVRVPVKQITVQPLDGDPAKLREQSFDSWHDASWFLAMRAKDASATCADKLNFKVIWANGIEYSGRYDLLASDMWPLIENQVRGFMNFLAAEQPPAVSEATRAGAAMMLKELDMGQHRPDPAPKDWTVVRDYRDGAPVQGAPRLETELYAAYA